jgi:hypothetical protein
LKRFHYDAHGPQKIWKKVGYPLELEIPKEVFPPHKRNSYLTRGAFPRYRLISVVYHHGKNASGGHYTVDLRRQEGKEWIRMDDTILRRIRAEDVAEGGAEEDPKVLAAALEQHKNDAGKSKNFFAQIDMEEEEAEKGAWSQVDGCRQRRGDPQLGRQEDADAKGKRQGQQGGLHPVLPAHRDLKRVLDGGMIYDMGRFCQLFLHRHLRNDQKLSRSICGGDNEEYTATSTPRRCFACSIVWCCQKSRSIGWPGCFDTLRWVSKTRPLMTIQS